MDEDKIKKHKPDTLSNSCSNRCLFRIFLTLLHLIVPRSLLWISIPLI